MTDGVDDFARLLAEVLDDGGHFGHRRHVHLSWLAVLRHGVPRATEVVSQGIRRTASAAGVPQKFNVTMTRAWVELVGHHVALDLADGNAPDRAAGDARPDARATRPDARATRPDARATRAAFDAFVDRYPALLDKALLGRYYLPATLAGEAARIGWVEPDLAPLPTVDGRGEGHAGSAHC